jgi:hypothetical protein
MDPTNEFAAPQSTNNEFSAPQTNNNEFGCDVSASSTTDYIANYDDSHGSIPDVDVQHEGTVSVECDGHISGFFGF